MFETTINAVEQYYQKRRQARAPEADIQLVQEIHRRLRQLEHLYREILGLQQEVLGEQAARHGKLPEGTKRIVVFTHFGRPPESGAGGKDFAPLSTQERLLMSAEAFYYLAHRIKTIVSKCRSRLPGLGSLPSAGVTRVRNNLLEHADKGGGTTVFSYSVSEAAGIRLRPVAAVGDRPPYVDEGILKNAADFGSVVERAFRKGLAA